MIYIGIVNKIKSEHKSGIYGRKPIPKKEYLEILKENALPIGLGLATSFIPFYGAIRFIPAIASTSATLFKKKKWSSSSEIILQKHLPINSEKQIIIENDSLLNDYSVDDKLFYGLFDEFPIKELAFNKIMNSKGGASFNIVEKCNVAEKYEHINNGHFNEGIYIIHPKNEKILIPLNNSNQLIQSIILEETIRAYEALGAKKIEIDDITVYKADVGGKKGNVEAKANFNRNKKSLRVKKFGKSKFDPNRALKDKYFIQDIPAVMTTIESRIEGNQIEESFTENINLSLGLDTNVLDLFKINANFDYKREWSFKVEFYDKSELEL